MLAFGSALPKLRQRIEKDLAMKDLSRERVLATIVRLLETTYIRVGNEEYARDNHSYGLTTMRNKHVKVMGTTITFNFRGKSGVQRTVRLTDKRLSRVIRRCQDIPGYELFQYVDDAGNRHSIDSGDVNEYLREISGMDITAKDFRTWAGTLLACMLLRQFESSDSEKTAKTNIVAAIRDVAKRLGNTPAVCRKCYVHPSILEIYLRGKLARRLKVRQPNSTNAAKAMRKEENELIRLLKRMT
jgi:DNA topoisomerase-1